MDLLDDPPPATATQILHDEPQKSKPNAETTKSSNHTNENITSSQKVTASTTTKNKKQSSISDLVTPTKGRNESFNNNKEHEGQDDNEHEGQDDNVKKKQSVTATSNTQPLQR